MFQTFDQTDAPEAARPRIEALRGRMRLEGIDWLIVPHADAFQSEYLPPSAERLAWLTGFTGSAGSAVIGHARAALFADGRYTLQARQQTDPELFEQVSLVRTSPREWLGRHVADNEVIGFDPWLHTRSDIETLEKALSGSGIDLKPLATNPVDAIWIDRPAPPAEPIVLQPAELAGEEVADKLDRVRERMKGADVLVVTDPTSVMWLLNLRGSDVPHTPLALVRAVVTPEIAVLFADPSRVSEGACTATAEHLALRPAAEFETVLAEHAANSTVMLDPGHAPIRLHTLVAEAGGTVVQAPDPARLPRAIKNTTELEGARAAHIRDGAAITTFLAWLDAQPPGTVTEIEAARTLEASRRDLAPADRPLRELSFDTIAGSGPNGAIVHYRVSETSNRTLQAGELFLCDSGAQYDDGTTDITRTVPIGEVGLEERRAFTLVLAGHVAIATARFPVGTRGVDLDPLARRSLWQHGLDYAHGTGHGVGSYLAVHEGPQSISRRGMHELHPGMILSNEPGYYREGRYGIRIENLVVVQEKPAQPREGWPEPADMLGFETITLAPIDTRLVEPDLLSPTERDWLNTYHADVREILGPLVTADVRTWLELRTQPI